LPGETVWSIRRVEIGEPNGNSKVNVGGGWDRMGIAVVSNPPF
jgi:hypothetical protein